MKDILVIEDDEAIRSVLTSYLENEGYTVENCVDGAAALERLEKEKFGVILLDMAMPGVDGWDFLQLKRANKKIRHVPVIINSASHEIYTIEKDVVASVKKPFDEDFFPLIRRHA